MRKILFLLLLLLPLSVWAQDSLDLEAFNSQRLAINRTGMTILGSWALGNMAVSGIALSGSQGVTKKFHQMNIGWNAVNAIIAGFGYYGAISGHTDLTLAQSIQEHESIKRILLFNAGLDLGYMAGGAWMLEKAKTSSKSAQWKGFGRAVIYNGAFLFAFDVVMYLIHQNHEGSLYQNLPEITGGVNGIGLLWRF